MNFLPLILFLTFSQQPSTPTCDYTSFPNYWSCTTLPPPTPTPTLVPVVPSITPAPTAVSTPTPVPTLVPVQPQAGLPCPQWVHAAQATIGPDGKMYPTWHLPVDPASGCLFGHEHGADPTTSKANAEMPAFGYAASVGGMTEPHTGYKVFVMNEGDIVESNAPLKVSDDNIRLVFHMGTSGIGRYVQQFHSFQLDYVARGRVAHLQGLADTSPTDLNGSTCDTPRRGGKDFSTLGCTDTYEIWNSSKFQVYVPGGFMGINETIVGLLTSPAVFDPITTRDPIDNSMLVYTENIKPANNSSTLSGVDPTSPDAFFQGCRREFYSGPLFFNNLDGPTEYYTDAYGRVLTTKEGLKQYISNSLGDKAVVFKGRQDYCGNGIHTPN